jgi:hypothetical protein
MNVIDKILNEWSFRCHDGIVDMNDPKKVSILKEVLIEEGIDDDIVDAVLNLPKDDQASEEKKQKALAVLTSISNDEKEKEIEQIEDEVSPKDFKTIYNKIIPYLEKDKGLPDKETLALISTFVLKDEEESLINYYNKEPKFEIDDPNFSILEFPKKELNPDTVDDIYKLMGGSSGTKGVGKEEYFLVAFYKNVKKRSQGDLTIDGINYEIKGEEAILAPSNFTRGTFTTNVKPFLIEFSQNLLKNLESFLLKKELSQKEKDQMDAFINRRKDEFDLIINKFKEDEGWATRVSKIYNRYKTATGIKKNNISLLTSSDINKIFLNTLEEELKKIYSNIKLPNIIENSNISPDKLKKVIASYLVDKIKMPEPVMFISSKGTIKVFKTKEEIINAINNNILQISALSDTVPRLKLST